MNSRHTLAVTRWLLATCALAGIVLVYRKWLHVNTATVALSLLLLVLVLAAEWGLRYAVAISIAATACYNFFFLPPLYTFTVAETQNWIALFAFLATSIIASRLSQRVRDEADDAKAHQRELDMLFRLSRELLQSESVVTLLSSLPATAAGITSATGGALYLIEGDRLYQSGSSSISNVEVPHLFKLANALTSTQTEGEDVQIPLRSGVRPRGLLVLRLPQLSNETADAMARLISLAVDRAQALENVARDEAAKKSERLRTLMIDSITHELRTPLTSIKGAATALLGGEMAGADERELLNIINEESDRLNDLVSEAVEMSQLDTQQVQMHMEKEAIHQLMEKALNACAWIKSQHPLRIEIPQPLTITVDPTFFQKALCNLLENAAKYSPVGTPIAISARMAGSRVQISVADQGSGIDESEQGLIFERFYRARNRSGSTPGTGMGLAISRAVIQAHRGELTVVSQPSRGSVFTISLPFEGS
jgi:two-component system sensor histidine kinase KdpD